MLMKEAIVSKWVLIFIILALLDTAASAQRCSNFGWNRTGGVEETTCLAVPKNVEKPAAVTSTVSAHKAKRPQAPVRRIHEDAATTIKADKAERPAPAKSDAAHAEKRVALVIGNATYKNTATLRVLQANSLFERKQFLHR
jgi:hypothetical protein